MHALTAVHTKTYRDSGLWTQEVLGSQLAQHDADTVAVVDRDGYRQHTYGELERDATRLAQYLGSLGVTAGEVVSVQLPNIYEAVVAAVAVHKLGAVINPILPNYRQQELSHIFVTAEPRALLTPHVYRGFDYVAMLDAMDTDIHHIVVGEETTADRPSLDSILRNDAFKDIKLSGPTAEAVSELIFSSGTEAAPKAILHSEQTVNFSLRTAYQDMQLNGSDVVWMPSPVGHSTGFNYGLRFALYHGLKLVLQDTWNPESAIDLIRSQGCSYTLAATTFLDDLVKILEQRGEQLPFSCFGCGGAPVPAELVRRAKKQGIQVRRLYGSTEVLVATWNRSSSGPEQLENSDGLPLSNIELEIRNDDGAVAATGESGEIFVRGPNTCLGFFNDPERTGLLFDPEGWVRSGDLGIQDSDGYLHVIGRRKEIIIRGGLNIAPREIEELLLRFSEVKKAAVLPLPHPRLGEYCCAAVVLGKGEHITIADLTKRLRDLGVAQYKWPERLIHLSELPTTASGKVQKHKIVSMLQQQEIPIDIDDCRLLYDSEVVDV